jgi:hypothetical protein
MQQHIIIDVALLFLYAVIEWFTFLNVTYLFLCNIKLSFSKMQQLVKNIFLINVIITYAFALISS